MDRVKTFLKYALWIILFIIISELIIDVGLNSQYRDIKRKDNIEQVQIYQAEATLVNGRIRGIISNNGEEDISNKFVRINFYSKRDGYLGKKYIEINQLNKDETQPLEVLFELQDVGSYEVQIVDEKEPTPEIKEVLKEMITPELIVKTLIVCIFIL